MMKSYADIRIEDRHLVILQFMAEEPNYRMTTSLLQDALDTIGHREPHDVILADAAWLKDVGLVSIETLGPFQVLQLTPRGYDVATGRAVVPGVKRPGPQS